MKRVMALLAVIVACSVFCSDVALAQSIYRPPRTPFQASRPTFSPWFGLFQRDTGALDNYHTFVRPEFELRRTLTQQQRALQQQGAGLQDLQQNVYMLQRPAEMRPTGSGSQFMNYSHYYNMGRR